MRPETMQMSTDEQFVSRSFYSTFFNKSHLPLGVWLHGNFSTFHDNHGGAIVRCMGRWPDHDRASGEVCEWQSPIPDWDKNPEFYEDSMRPGAQVLNCRETEIILHDLVTSTPALEKEIRRRDDAERSASEASQRAGAERARLRAEAEERKAVQALVERKNKFYDEMKRAGMPPDPELEALLNNLNTFTGVAP